VGNHHDFVIMAIVDELVSLEVGLSLELVDSDRLLVDGLESLNVLDLEV